MSATLEQPALSKDGNPSASLLPIPELDPEYIFLDEPRLRMDPAAELERLRPLLAEYDPRAEPVQIHHAPIEYGVLIAKFIGYSLLGAITIGIGLMILAPFLALGGC
jgi:hypothetical protein